MKPGLVMVLALPATFSSRARAADEFSIAVQDTREPRGRICHWKVTNHSRRFINQVVIVQALGHPWHARNFNGDAPEGWSASEGVAGGRGTIWLPNEPDIALAPGQTLEFRLWFDPQPGDAPFPCTELEIFADGPPVLPAHVEKAHLALSIAALVATRFPSSPGPRAEDRVELRGSISIHNPGPTDAMLSLGTLYGNRRAFPERVQLVLSDEAGREHPLRLAGADMSVSGRLDPMEVPLPAGATYSVAGPWQGYDLPPGKYRVVARYAGANGGLLNGGMGIFGNWSEKVESAAVEVVLP